MQRQSEIHGILASACGLVAEYLDANQTHTGGGAIAIFAKVGEGLIAVPLQIHLHPVDQVQKRLLGQIKLLHGRKQLLAKLARGNALVNRFDFPAPILQLRVRVSSSLVFIDYVVEQTAECVDVFDRSPLCPRQQQE